MKRVKLIMSICALALAGLGMGLSACGEVAGDECVSDTECSGDQLCFTEGTGDNICVVNCTPPDNSGACRDSEMCIDMSGNNKGCAPKSQLPGDDTGTDAGMDADMTDGGMDAGECQSNADCEGTMICNDMNMCVEQAPEFKYLQIKDTTETDNPDAMTCDAEDAGSDIYAAELRDSEGNTLGYGKFVDSDTVGSNNTHGGNGMAVLTGDASTLDTGGDNICPSESFGPSTVVSLGCGGALVVEFTDDNGDTITLEKGQQVVVYEYGKQCCSDPDACPNEHYSASICSSQSAAEDITGADRDMDGNYPTCDNAELLGGFGENPGTINDQSYPSSE